MKSQNRKNSLTILVTGSAGFIARNLIENLKNIRDGKNQTYPELNDRIGEILEYSSSSGLELLEDYCSRADFVFHLAGVNRPETKEAFMKGNRDFTAELIKRLEKCGNPCPVMISSSIQASLTGRFAGSEYGRSKAAAEQIVFEHGVRTGAKALVYRFPNVFGKWCRPNYNSAVATFCYT